MSEAIRNAQPPSKLQPKRLPYLGLDGYITSTYESAHGSRKILRLPGLHYFLCNPCYNYDSNSAVKLKWRSSACDTRKYDELVDAFLAQLAQRTHAFYKNNSFEGNNFERISRCTIVNTALESWDRHRHVDVSTLEIDWEMTELRGDVHSTEHWECCLL